jgi:acyl-CoA synthetase (AMP-forming)/AMP-acid ligase II
VITPEGSLKITDRSKDIIISGGENISSVEVEGVLFKHEHVLETAVVARPDSLWGETPCAFVTLKPGAPPLTGEQLIAYCREQLAHFKCPKTIVFSELPKTSTGKVQKYVLRERARALQRVLCGELLTLPRDQTTRLKVARCSPRTSCCSARGLARRARAAADAAHAADGGRRSRFHR